MKESSELDDVGSLTNSRQLFVAVDRHLGLRPEATSADCARQIGFVQQLTRKAVFVDYDPKTVWHR